MTLAEKQEQMIGKINGYGDCFEQYSYLIVKSGHLPQLAAEKRTQENLVSGCQSVVWLALTVEAGMLRIEGDSDTLILRGVIQLLRELLDGEPAAEAATLHVRLFEETELGATFTSDRSTGIKSMLRMIREAARLA